MNRLLLVTVPAANLCGTLMVYALVNALLPEHHEFVHVDPLTIVLMAYVVLALASVVVWSRRRADIVWRWLREDRESDAAERERVLR